MERSRRKHILIVNQHGENRGDEAAMRAMLNSLERELGDVKFAAIVQFKDRNLKLNFRQNIRIINMIMPIHHAIVLSLYAVAKSFKIEIPQLLTKQTRKIIDAYKTANLVVSAPGGPYFGDIYYKHELAHWFYIWLACLYKKPPFLYATSAGPFNLKLMNVVRKHFYKRFGTLCVREQISKNFLHGLLGKEITIHLTADSALQESAEPYERTLYFKNKRTFLANKYLISVSAIQYGYPGESNVSECQDRYDQAILRCLEHLGAKLDCHFLFFPQLYGRVHSDVTYLEYLGHSLPETFHWEIVDPNADSDMQRRLFGMTDLCIASRYHPQIFAASSGVPGICIYYEHKAIGFMSSLGLKDYAFDIRNLYPDAMCTKLDEAIDNHDELSSLIKNNIVEIRTRAEKTNKFAIEYFKKVNNATC
ncbi:polysaccharide pyruvyl transferase family protein [Thermodesulfobacteriota bacterium]